MPIQLLLSSILNIESIFYKVLSANDTRRLVDPHSNCVTQLTTKKYALADVVLSFLWQCAIITASCIWNN